MNDSFNSAKDLINNYFSSVSDNNKNAAEIESSWRGILMQLRDLNKQQDTKRSDIGSQLADHSRIIDFKNGTLFIETDHPTRLQLFYFYKDFILRELKKKYPQLNINNLSFFMGKQKKEQTNTLRDVSSDEMEKAIEKRTRGLEEFSEKNDIENTEKEVPEEVKKLFEGFFK